MAGEGDGEAKHARTRSGIPFDESTTAKIRFWKDAPHVTLYIDDYSILEEVRDLKELRMGDHCVVGLNPVRKLCGCCDAFVFWLASWEILKASHHFIMAEDVVRVGTDNVPLNRRGLPAKICEYSNTPAGALRLLCQVGLRRFMSDPAPFHQLTLHDYQDGRSVFGIYRVVEEMSQREREEVVAEARTLTQSWEPYSFIFRNCEHAAWGLSAGSRRWVSPQVPWLLYNTFRFLLQLVACFALWQLGGLCGADEELWGLRGYLLTFVYHGLATLPVALQVLVCLVRCTVQLTVQKEYLGDLVYYFLLTKEVARATFSGGLAIATMSLLPRMVWRGGSLPLACFLVLTAFNITDVIFNVSMQVVTRALNESGTGIPVAVFATERERRRRRLSSGARADGKPAVLWEATSKSDRERQIEPPGPSPSRTSGGARGSGSVRRRAVAKDSD